MGDLIDSVFISDYRGLGFAAGVRLAKLRGSWLRSLGNGGQRTAPYIS